VAVTDEPSLFPSLDPAPSGAGPAGEIVESRATRDRLVSRVEVLDKVKALRLLPDGVHVTTDLVANYYEVDPDAVEACVRDNRTELESNGYQVLTGERLSAFKAECGYRSRTPRLGLFTRRTVLNVGMLLRESDVAKRVRSMLLDVEADSAVATFDVTSLDGVAQLLEAAQRSLAMARAERQRADNAEARAEVAEDELRKMRAAGGLILRTFRKTYFPDVGEKVFLAHLYRKDYLIDQRPCWDNGDRKRDSDGNLIYGKQHNHPGHAGLRWLKLEGTGEYGGKRRAETRVRPHSELDFVERLVQDGFPRYDHPQIGAAS
jgi:hypothetical protein